MYTHHPSLDQRITVDVSTAYDFLVSLHVARTQDGQAQAVAARNLPDSIREDMEWLFGGDISLGMNLAPLVFERGWKSSADLVAGVKEMPPFEVLSALLTLGDTPPEEATSRKRIVKRVMTKGVMDDDLATQLDSEGLERSVLARLADDPKGVIRKLTALLTTYGKVFSSEEEALRGRLEVGAEQARSAIASKGPDSVIEHLTGGWSLRNASRFRSIVLAPSEYIKPFISTRVLEPSLAFIIYPLPRADDSSGESLADALKALAHPQRLAILQHVSLAPATGQELAKLVNLTEATVHHHTALLRSVGLLSSERVGNRVYHRANSRRLGHLLEEVSDFVRQEPLDLEEPASTESEELNSEVKPA